MIDLCFSCDPVGDCVLSYPCVGGSEALLVVESRPSIKRTETIKSLSQQDFLYKNLENYAENRRGKPDMSMLVEVTGGSSCIGRDADPT